VISLITFKYIFEPDVKMSILAILLTTIQMYLENLSDQKEKVEYVRGSGCEGEKCRERGKRRGDDYLFFCLYFPPIS
jgi:hypothetical protein